MKKNVEVSQQDASDCGAACLASVAAYYGLQLPISRLRQLAGTNKQGTTIQGMIDAAERISFEAKGARAKSEKLPVIPLPAICMIILPNSSSHFIVIFKISRKKIVVMDPAVGKLRSWPIDSFLTKWNGILILLRPNERFRKEDLKVSVIRKFWILVQPHGNLMFQALLAAILYTILGLSTSFYLQKIIDHVLTDGNERLLNLMSVAMILILALQFAFNYFKSIIGLNTAQSIDAKLLLGYCRHVLHLPRTFFNSMRVGEIISRTNDAVKIRIFINDIALNIIVNVLIVSLSLSLMFFYYWRLALLMVAILPFMLILYWLGNRINKIWQRKMMEQAATVESQLIENMQAINTIKYFGLENLSYEKAESKLILLLKYAYRSNSRNVLIQNLMEVITHFFTIVVLWMGSRLVITHELSAGQLLSFYALIGYFTGPAFSLISVNKNLQDAFIAADRLFEILDLEYESERPGSGLISDWTGDIEFQHVEFSYGPGTKVFQDLSIKIRKNSVTGIAGANGCGKSTIASLLTRVYIPDKGKIQIGGLDVMLLDLKDLRSEISILPQDIDIFTDSLIANIVMDDDNPDLKRVVEICRLLGIDEWIEKWPQNYFEPLHESGTGLSGGQKQKIALARSIYKKANYLILDEPNTFLDQLGEQRLMKAIEICKKEGKTIIVIVHNADILNKCDEIIFLKDGQAHEQGSHDQLMKLEGEYANLWKKG